MTTKCACPGKCGGGGGGGGGDSGHHSSSSKIGVPGLVILSVYVAIMIMLNMADLLINVTLGSLF